MEQLFTNFGITEFIIIYLSMGMFLWIIKAFVDGLSLEEVKTSDYILLLTWPFHIANSVGVGVKVLYMVVKFVISFIYTAIFKQKG